MDQTISVDHDASAVTKIASSQLLGTLLTFPPSVRHLVDVTMFWSAASGGVRRYLMRKRAALRPLPGWVHTVVAPGALGPALVDCGGVPLPFSGGYRLPLRRRYAAMLIARQSPSLIEVADPYRLAWAGLDAAQRLGVPAVAFCHSNLPAMAARLAGAEGVAARWARRAAEDYLRRVYARFDLVLAPSAAMANELLRLGIERVEHQALGVDSRIYHPSRRDPRKRELWRQTLALPADARLLLYAGRFAPEKNLPILVKAVEKLGAPYYLLVVGSGPRLPRGERVRVLPYEASEAELARIYASADGFVHAGDQETFGLSALEAMASGIPLAVRAAAGLGELVGDGAGIAVDSAAADDWAEAIHGLFDEKHEARIRTARLRAEALDWRKVIPGLLRRYEALLAGVPTAEAARRRAFESGVQATPATAPAAS